MRIRMLFTSLAVLLTTCATAPAAHAVVVPHVIDHRPVIASDAGPTVALMTPGRRGTDGQFCGGTAIAASLVLTAAHCVEDETARTVDVVAGRARLSDDAAGRRVRVTRIVRAPGWNAKTARNDAAVLSTAQPLGVAPVTLPGAKDSLFEAPGRSGILAGWGLTSNDGAQSDDLRATTMPVRSDSACTGPYGADYDARSMLCVGGGANASCNGDSGGPLVVVVAGQPRQVGIVSFAGERCAQRGVPDVFTRVRSQMRWIAPLIGGAVPPARPAVARARFGHINCGPVRCRVEIRVRSDRDVSRLVVRAARRGSRAHAARAHRIAPGRWVARLPLPLGTVALRAKLLRADGSRAGRAARLLVDVT